ncbi:hypothetical protein NDU88_007635 [Pleurodeles waltl]|uniref:Uncharacterized protein n=1 Tax=Pleurodeles waltl TaxID=8319 RepID=A0AAV7U1T2_PLEWA|nr:hypothetical protein NDU88_007635 [Pleurodeles waltl]
MQTVKYILGPSYGGPATPPPAIRFPAGEPPGTGWREGESESPSWRSKLRRLGGFLGGSGKPAGDRRETGGRPAGDRRFPFSDRG